MKGTLTVMPVKSLYPLRKRANAHAWLLAPLCALALGGCGPINPNFHTIIWRDAADYTIEGALTPGFATRARVGYVLGEGDNPDAGSFRNVGGQDAGITPQGIYIPSAILTLDANKRFRHTFKSSKRFVLVKIFAWDDTRSNGVRDADEPLGSVWELRKEDLRGWSYNAPDWNQFNFNFTR